jgi:hypothetical protein
VRDAGGFRDGGELRLPSVGASRLFREATAMAEGLGRLRA